VMPECGRCAISRIAQVPRPSRAKAASQRSRRSRMAILGELKQPNLLLELSRRAGKPITALYAAWLLCQLLTGYHSAWPMVSLPSRLRLGRWHGRQWKRSAAAEDEFGSGPIMLVLDIADDLFQDVFQSDESEDFVVLISNQRHGP